jgi:hypothetical protein
MGAVGRAASITIAAAARVLLHATQPVAMGQCCNANSGALPPAAKTGNAYLVLPTSCCPRFSSRPQYLPPQVVLYNNPLWSRWDRQQHPNKAAAGQVHVHVY